MKTKEEQIASIQAILGPVKSKNHTGRRNPKKVDRHIWTIEEELLAIELYKNKATDEEIFTAIWDTELKFASMKMKLSNIKFLDTGEGLENVSETTRTLWEKNK